MHTTKIEQHKEALETEVEIKLTLKHIIYLCQEFQKLVGEYSECPCPVCDAKKAQLLYITAHLIRMAEKEIGEQKVEEVVQAVDELNQTLVSSKGELEKIMKMFSKQKPHGQA